MVSLFDDSLFTELDKSLEPEEISNILAEKEGDTKKKGISGGDTSESEDEDGKDDAEDDKRGMVIGAHKRVHVVYIVYVQSHSLSYTQ